MRQVLVVAGILPAFCFFHSACPPILMAGLPADLNGGLARRLFGGRLFFFSRSHACLSADLNGGRGNAPLAAPRDPFILTRLTRRAGKRRGRLPPS
jgi:hypothetical protein